VSDIVWDVPYLPIDPKDVGRSYEAVIRVNSQSGKGGVAYVLKTNHHLDLPRRLQIEFSRIIQDYTDVRGGEVTPERIWFLFSDTYLTQPDTPWGRISVRDHHIDTGAGDTCHLTLHVETAGEPVTLAGAGTDLSEALTTALAPLRHVSVLETVSQPFDTPDGQTVCVYAECLVDGEVRWRVGIETDLTRALVDAVVSAANRHAGRPVPAQPYDRPDSAGRDS
jgi:2-isopropylmalate synthase